MKLLIKFVNARYNNSQYNLDKFTTLISHNNKSNEYSLIISGFNDGFVARVGNAHYFTVLVNPYKDEIDVFKALFIKEMNNLPQSVTDLIDPSLLAYSGTLTLKFPLKNITKGKIYNEISYENY